MLGKQGVPLLKWDFSVHSKYRFCLENASCRRVIIRKGGIVLINELNFQFAGGVISKLSLKFGIYQMRPQTPGVSPKMFVSAESCVALQSKKTF
jgi:hypothetical protein